MAQPDIDYDTEFAALTTLLGPLTAPTLPPAPWQASMQAPTSTPATETTQERQQERPETDFGVAGPQAQGDLFIVPAALLGSLPATAVPTLVGSGVPLLDGGPGGNVHSLTGTGVTWAPVLATDGATLGVLTVPEGTVAQVLHTEEHLPLQVAPGTYIARRQRRWTPPPETTQQGRQWSPQSLVQGSVEWFERFE